ncbi:hypothetical protein J437_LFUL003839 [Ladona fulva]|uniref:Strictosidine synthase conserved region domain-containing protein n=1 Tax=Ladona fulva TaxID=123851 RepID=A0A8K0KG84_LADFU|nr:hypothetical protein J437_LFUL003839 [Ladona fulva]
MEAAMPEEEDVVEKKKRRLVGTKSRRFMVVVAFLLVLLVAACLLLIFLPCLPPNLPFPPYNSTLPKPLVGNQIPKDWLSGAKPVSAFYSDANEDGNAAVLSGPESIARKGEMLYTGLLGGHLVSLSPKYGKVQVYNVTKFGEECEDISEGTKCGRPMGMRFHSDGFLYVTDAYLGLYKVNVETGEKIRLAKSHHYISGRRPSLPNDLDIAKDGTVYWSDASTNVKVEDVVLEFMSEPSGRLIRYNPVKEKSEAVIKNVQCANGVQLSPNEDFVLVAEGGKDRILRYYLKGPQKGTHDIFVDGLPGVPDKIRSSGRPEGGYLVWCIVSHGSAQNGGRGGGFLMWLRRNRIMRTLMMRGLFLLESIFKNSYDRFGDSFSKKMVYVLGNLAYMGPFLTSEGLVLELDAHGNITGSFFSKDRSVTMASEMHVLPGGRGGIKGLGNVYIGSPVNPHLLQVPIKEGKMLEMAMAYEKGNTLFDNQTLADGHQHEAMTTTFPETNQISTNVTSSIPETSTTATTDDISVSLNDTGNSLFTYPEEEEELNLKQVDNNSRENDYKTVSDVENTNQTSTESFLEAFFGTVTLDGLNAVTEVSLENSADDLSNSSDWLSDFSTNSTDSSGSLFTTLLEDDSRNMVSKYSDDTDGQYEEKSKGKEDYPQGSNNQSITESS